MEISRRGPGEASLVQDGHDLLDLVATEATEAEFDAVVTRLARLLGSPADIPRIAVTYREGLLAAVQADAPVELLFIEDDPHDEPPLRLLRRTVQADPAALDAAIAQAEGRVGGRGVS